MYFIFKELYGKDETAPICRYTVDIYNMPVPDDHYIKIIKGPMVRSIHPNPIPFHGGDDIRKRLELW